MLKNLKKYIPKRKYQERSQLEGRKKLGFLEKKQDYKIRSEDFHKKEAKYKKLKEMARTKNPEEFYHKMVNAKTIDGEHTSLREEKTLEERLGHQNKLLNLVNFKKSVQVKEKEKLLHDLQFNLDKVNPSNKKGSHTFFFNSVDECSNFEEIKNQNNSNDLLKKKRKPSKDQDDDVNDSNFKIKINNLKLKNKNVETLNKISSALSLQKHLLKDRKFKKLGEGSYKFFSERKR